jgi:small subunit ribosomal protein S16
MSVKIRLQRFGSHKRPFYRVVAITSKNKRDGKFLDILGNYEPFTNLINLDIEKINKWCLVGGAPTKTVKNLLKKFKNNKKS